VDLLLLDGAGGNAGVRNYPGLWNCTWQFGDRLTVESRRIRGTTPTVRVQRVSLHRGESLRLRSVEGQRIIGRKAVGKTRAGWKTDGQVPHIGRGYLVEDVVQRMAASYLQGGDGEHIAG
jgi:hypothetical protein